MSEVESLVASAWDPASPASSLVTLLAERYEGHADSETLLPRLREHVPTFWREFSKVYGDGPEAAAWAVRAVDAAVDGLADRPERLRDLDAAREGEPDWFQGSEEVAYMCYVDLFAGDLSGVREKIPYLEELGVTYLHLMPLLEPREGRNDGGYAVKDYRSVDPRLGSIDDLRALAADLHEADIKLALDFVMNHTAREHEWAQAAKAGDERFEGFYHTFEDRTLPDRYDETVPEVFPDFAPGNFVYDEDLNRWVWSSFYDFQWDLDYGNPDVFVQMLRELLHLTNVGTDVLRLDAVPFLWKELDTDCRNLPEAHSILRAYRALTRIAAPGALFKAEAIVSPEETIKYLGTGGYEGEECEIAYNAPLMAHLWHALASENTQLLERALRELPETPQSATWLNYVRCHDDIGWGLDDDDVRAVGQDPTATRRWCADFYAGDTPDSYAEGYRFQVDDDTGEARTSGTAAALTGLQNARVEGDAADVDTALSRMLMLHSVVFATKGMPLLYAGDELGQLNDFSYLDDPIKAQDNRWVHRPEMDWDTAANRETDGTVQQRLFDGISQLSAARKGTTPLHARADERVVAVPNDSVFVLERAYEGERLFVLANVSGTPQSVDVDRLVDDWESATFRALVREETAVYPDGRVLLEPYGYRWLRPDGDATPGEPVTTDIAVDVETEPGETVAVVGTLDVLGGWDPTRAVELSPTESPTWTGTIEVPAGTHFEFEWVRIRDGEVVEWAPHRYGTEAGSGQIRQFERP